MSTHPQQDVCCLMGDPIAGNPTQYMLEKAFAVADLDFDPGPFPIDAQGNQGVPFDLSFAEEFVDFPTVEEKPALPLGFQITRTESDQPAKVLRPAAWCKQPLPAWAQAAAAVVIFAAGMSVSAFRSPGRPRSS